MQDTDIFGPGESVLISDVNCTRLTTEKNVSQCLGTGIGTCDDSSRAGVICTREFGG